MRLITANNVNTAYEMGLAMLLKEGIKEPSRAGDVLVMPFPVTTQYVCPMERVLFDPVRDANPFFHLFEALWMLAGRKDATWLDQFVKDFSRRYAETNGEQHGAYGYRWRHHFTKAGEPEGVFGTDQLAVAIRRLKKDWTDRRVVIQMWNPEVDLDADKLDIPCNLCVLPRIVTDPDRDFSRPKLEITVMCRSNDAVWGAYGANAVHFAFLQEYLAAMIEVDTGHYYQHSNNFHVYTNVLDKVRVGGPIRDPYRTQDFNSKMTWCKLVTKPDTFDQELELFLSQPKEHVVFSNLFFNDVARPMYLAHACYKLGHWTKAFEFLATMPPSNDWYRAAHAWFMRRKAKADERKPRFSEGRPGGLLG
jgi:thymidylate synthase